MAPSGMSVRMRLRHKARADEGMTAETDEEAGVEDMAQLLF